MDKQLIAKRFSKAVHSYNEEASIQYEIAKHMIALLKGNINHCSIEQIFEFGCGTGQYTQLLIDHFTPGNMYINDLCPEMVESCQSIFDRSIEYITGDAENIDLPSNNDLITSCSTLQWFEDPFAFFDRCHTSLNDNGYLALSTFGENNLYEIRETTGEGLSYIAATELVKHLSNQYDIIHIEENIIEQYFDDPKQVLRHLKKTGVTGISNQRWTSRILLNFCNEYKNQYTTLNGVKLTYHPIYIIAKKKRK